ncbi:hypothetical protein KBB60_00270 [Patescibacteria group bacterium]|nr:hypothetical protein [Patescibacteria group bacterium]
MTGKNKNVFSTQERPLLKKYIGSSNLIIGKKRSCVDAIHASPPKRKEVLIAISGEKHNNKKRRWKRYRALRKAHEVYTAEIARSVAKKTGSSYFVPKKSRIYSDFNREIGAKRTIKNIPLIETPERVQNVIDIILKNTFKRIGIVNEEHKLIKTFLHVSIHGKANTKNDFVIANGMKSKLLPCHPQLACWAARFIRERVDKKYKVVVAREGHAFCGSATNVTRRFGQKGGFGLGENYQHVQIEISYRARKKHNKEIALVLSELIRYFDKKFYSLEEISSLPLLERDRHRLSGRLYYKKYIFRGKTAKNYIRLNPSLQKALGVKRSDTVLVNKQRFTVLNTWKKLQNKKLPILLTKMEISGPIVIEKTI